MEEATTQQTRDIDRMLDQCCASVVDAGTTLVQHSVDVLCLLGMSRVKPKGTNYLQEKLAVTAFWVCIAPQISHIILQMTKVIYEVDSADCQRNDGKLFQINPVQLACIRWEI